VGKKLKAVKAMTIDGQKVDIFERPGGFGFKDYGYRREDGTWGVGQKSIKQAIEDASTKKK